MKHLLKFLLLAMALVFPFQATDAFAYLNPGIGSLILQGLLGFLFVALAVWGLFWNRIKKFLDRVVRKND
jgi:hypothetical protein